MTCRLCGSSDVPLGWDICQPCDDAEVARMKAKAATQAMRVLRAAAGKSEFLVDALRELLMPPKSKSEAVIYMLSILQVPEIRELQGCPRDSLSKYHFGMGRYIRNHFKFWSEEGRLLMEDCCKGRVEVHPDEASAAIIEAIWEALRLPEVAANEVPVP